MNQIVVLEVEIVAIVSYGFKAAGPREKVLMLARASEGVPLPAGEVKQQNCLGGPDGRMSPLLASHGPDEVLT